MLKLRNIPCTQYIISDSRPKYSRILLLEINLDTVKINSEPPVASNINSGIIQYEKYLYPSEKQNRG